MRKNFYQRLTSRTSSRSLLFILSILYVSCRSEHPTKIVLKIDYYSLIHSLVNDSNDVKLNAAIDKAEQSPDKNFAFAFAEAYVLANPEAKLASLFTKPDGYFRIDMTNDEVLHELSGEIAERIVRSGKSLVHRVENTFGETPKIEFDKTGRTVILNIKGSYDKVRLKRLLQAPGSMDFCPVYTNLDLYSYIRNADSALSQELLPRPKQEVKDTGSLDALLASGDWQKKEHPILSITHVPDNLKKAQAPVVFYVLEKDITALDSYLMTSTVKSMLPIGLRFAYDQNSENHREDSLNVVAVYALNTSDERKLTENNIVSAEVDQDYASKDNRRISITLNRQGAKIFEAMTAQNLGKFIAIVVDGKVVFSPYVKSVVSGNMVTITSSFTKEEAEDLANTIKAGRLPLSLKVIEISEQ